MLDNAPIHQHLNKQFYTKDKVWNNSKQDGS